MSERRAESVDREALLAGYVAFSDALSRGVPDDTPEMDAAERAYSAVDGIIHDGPADVAWALVAELLRRAPDDDRLGAYAVGPLEDLVRLRGPEIVERVEAEARRDPRFRLALGGIWLAPGDMPPRVLERVVRASGGRIQPLGAAGAGGSGDAAG